jgi:hypothetical protein
VDEEKRLAAKRNSDLLVQLGMLAQKLERDAQDRLSGVTQGYLYFPAGNLTASQLPCNVPTDWPARLGSYLYPNGPSGPSGQFGSISADAVLELKEKAKYPLWSPELGRVLSAIQTRLEGFRNVLEGRRPRR